MTKQFNKEVKEGHFFYMQNIQLSIRIFINEVFPFNYLRIYAHVHFNPYLHLQSKLNWTKTCWCNGKLIQWNLCNPTTEFFDILWHPTKMYGPKVFLLTKIKAGYSDILYNPTHFPGPLVCQIRQVPTSCTIRHISLVPWCVRLDRFWHPVQSDTFPWSLGMSD